MIEYPRQGSVYCNVTRAKIAIALVYVVTCVICIPNFVSITVQSQPFRHTDRDLAMTQSCGGGDWNASSTQPPANSTPQPQLIWVVTFKLDNELDNFVHVLNFWIQALLVKLLPCCGLTVLSALLLSLIHI